jgi:hypothetical protein
VGHVTTSKAVQRDHGAHVIAKCAKLAGFRGAKTGRWYVPPKVARLTDDVKRCIATRGGFDRDMIGVRFEMPAVKGHEPEVGAQSHLFFDARMSE